MSDADILKSYPTLRAEDVANAWASKNCIEKRSTGRLPKTKCVKNTNVSDTPLSH